MTLVFTAFAVLTILALAGGLFRWLDKHEQTLTEPEWYSRPAGDEGAGMSPRSGSVSVPVLAWRGTERTR